MLHTYADFCMYQHTCDCWNKYQITRKLFYSFLVNLKFILVMLLSQSYGSTLHVPVIAIYNLNEVHFSDQTTNF